jgi:hypothetical protein
LKTPARISTPKYAFALFLFIVLLKSEYVTQCLLDSRLNQVFLKDFACAYSCILFSFMLRNYLVFADSKHTHNMMQPPPCLKI